MTHSGNGEKTRGISKIPPPGVNPNSIMSRLCGVLAHLLSESEGRRLQINDPIVSSKLNDLKELTRRATMIAGIAKEHRISLETALKLNGQLYLIIYSKSTY